MSSCLQSSNVIRKSSCKQLFDDYEPSQSQDFTDLAIGKNGQNFSLAKVYGISILKDVDKNCKNEYLTVTEFPKMVCMSDSMLEIKSDNHSMADAICNPPNHCQLKNLNRSEGTFSSLTTSNIQENELYASVNESIEPWSIHRTPVKLRGMYVWSPFFKYNVT